KLIFGLGNPGQKHKDNRHNVGYMVVDELAKVRGAAFKRSFTLSASCAKIQIGNERALLLKPRAFMNNSGACVRKALNHYKVSAEDWLVIHDDADLPLGAVRFRAKGSGGGHRGLGSIIEALETEQINRLKIGIGRPEEADLTEYVLSDFTPQEQEILHQVFSEAVSVCIEWLDRRGNLQ
ncbi:MAG: aminoacyl-tRNA hydrolase, partial [Candidatus Omnitrophota bacterium]